MAAATVTTIKTSCGDDFRRFRALDPEVGVSGLRARLQGLYEDRLGGRTWQMYYVDSDGDLITIAEDGDVELAYEAAADAGSSVVRLYVEPDREPEARRHCTPRRTPDPCGVFLDHLFGGLAGQRGPCGPCPFPFGPRRGGRKCGKKEESDGAKAAADEVAPEVAREPTVAADNAWVPRDTPSPAKSPTSAPVPPQTSPVTSDTEPNEYVHVKAPEQQEQQKEQKEQQKEPEVPKPQAGPNTRWERELAILKEMGISVDEERLTASLDRHQGIIAGVLSEVFARMQ